MKMTRICWRRTLFKRKRFQLKRPILKLMRPISLWKRPSFNWKRRKKWKRSIHGINNSMVEGTTQEENGIQATDTSDSDISIKKTNLPQSSDGGNQNSPEDPSWYQPICSSSVYLQSESTDQNNTSLDIELLCNSFENQCNIHPYKPEYQTSNQCQSLKQKLQKRQMTRKRQKKQKRLERQEMWKTTTTQPSDSENQGLSWYQPTISKSDYPRSESTSQNNTSLYLNPSETRNIDIETINNFHEVTLDDFKTIVLYKEQINTFSQLSIKKIPKWKLITDIKIGLEPGPYFIEQKGLTDQNTGEVIVLHCTALLVFHDRPWEYFDSRGIPLHDIPGIKVISNYIPFQHQDLNTCGLHAVYFLSERHKLGSMEEVKKSYPSQRLDLPSNNNKFDSLLLNDNYILEHFKNIYNNYTHQLMVQSIDYLSSRIASQNEFY